PRPPRSGGVVDGGRRRRLAERLHRVHTRRLAGVGVAAGEDAPLAHQHPPELARLRLEDLELRRHDHLSFVRRCSVVNFYVPANDVTGMAPGATRSWSRRRWLYGAAGTAVGITPASSRIRAGGRCSSVIRAPRSDRASSMALQRAAGAPIMPPSPTPR